MKHNTTLKDLTAKYDAFILDTKIFFDKGGVNKQAKDFVKSLFNEKVFIFVCNTIQSNEMVSYTINSLGIEIGIEHILTSGDLAKAILCDVKHPLIGKNPLVYNFGDKSFFDFPEDILTKISLKNKIDEAKICLLTKIARSDEPIESYKEELKKGVDNGCVAICADPTELLYDGEKVVYYPGYFANIYKDLGGKVIDTGKPDRVILYKALIHMANNNIKDKTNILLLAQDYNHDVVGACNVGIDSAVILNQKNIEIFSQINWDHFNDLTDISSEYFEEEARPNYMVDLT
ncbi:MAG: HAD-superfamily subfamily hydrolase [Rickettsiaceae bacterium]|jgi:HAD superfamily hydrolase (TIGR01459 family)|nr:HAD-superfamily subfamily hydrolase [Rickettsiaceae bacterium]